MSEIISYPRFISNSPCGRDMYESGSQQKTAQGITEHIKSDASGYRLIGMDGEWGSGKSNAISIIKEQLGSSYHLFIYDTWAHQEDLQRRSFLEEFTDNLQKYHIVDQKEWRKKLDSLLAKKKESIKKTVPKLGNGIIASLLVFVTLPFANAVSGITPHWYLKALITLFPLLVALCIWIYTYHKKKEKLTLAEFFYVFKEKDLEEVSEETISESEPSVRKFREWLMDLSNSVSKNVIVVFDNMDRLPPDRVKVIWTLLHTFFSSETYPKFWVIVPFDRGHIREAFLSEQADAIENTNHFINKTFPVIFNISPALLTDWKHFFSTKFSDAFGQAEREEYDITRKIFDLYNPSITPRKIIAFINDLVSLRLIAAKDIKLRYIAIFVINRQAIAQQPVFQILKKSFLTPSQNLFAGDDAVSDNIAALLYNTSIEKAAQVTLQREIEVAIREKRINDLKEFSKHPDFISMLEQIQTEDIDIESTATCLSEIEKSIEIPDVNSFQVIWDRVVGKQLSLQLQEVRFTEVFKILIIKSRPDQRKRLLSYLLKEFHGVREISGSKYYDAFSEMEKHLHDHKIEIDCLPMITGREVVPEVFVDYLEQAGENYQRYKVTCNNTALDKYFEEKVPDELSRADLIQYIKDTYKFPKTLEAIQKNIRANLTTLANVDFVFDAYKEVSATTLLSTRLTDTKIYELLASAKVDSEEYLELSAMRIARGASFTSQGTADAAILERIDPEFINEVASRIQHYAHYGTLLLSVSPWPKPALIAIVNQIVSTGLGEALAIEKVIPEFNRISEALKVTSEFLLTRLNGWSRVLKEKLTTANLKQVIPELSFYDAAIGTNNELMQIIFNVAAEYVDETTGDEWMLAFKEENSYLAGLLKRLLTSNKIQSLPDATFNAYKESLKAIASTPGEYEDGSDDIDLWNILYERSDKIHLQATIKNIRDIFLRDVDITSEQFAFFEPLLREYGVLAEKPGDVVRKILTPLLGSKDCLHIMTARYEFYTALIIDGENDSFDFIDKLREKIEMETIEEYIKLSSEINKHLVSRIRILSGKYYSQQNEEGVEISDTLKRIIEQEKQLHFKIDNNIVNGEDPDVGNPKKLFVKYTYKGQEDEKVFDEGKWFRIP